MWTKNDPVAGDRDRVHRRDSDSADGDYLIRRPADSEAKTSQWYADLKYCVDHFHYLNDWEANFILSLAGYRYPSEKQRDKLALIRKIELALTVRRGRARR